MEAGERLYVELNGASQSFADYDELREWRAAEYAAWQFLQNSPAWGSWNVISARMNELNSQIEAFANQDQAISSLRETFEAIYGQGRSDAAIYSGSELGKLIIGIGGARGAEAADFAYAFHQRRASLSQARFADELGAAVLVAMPDFILPEELSSRQRAERENDRRSVARSLQLVEEQGREREIEWRELRTRLRRRYLNWATRGMRRAIKSEAEHDAAMNVAIDRITETEAAYKEVMRLQAPVQYWSDKAVGHKIKEDVARSRVVWYFVILIPVLVLMFGIAGCVLLRDDKASAQLYILVGGALATLIGTVFWIGRILTRLYLSDHHLRHDAEERAVMAQTYLALTNEQAAQDVDRQIVLAALFRSTPDGIVKDDGPPDVSIAAILSRVLSGNQR